MKFCPKCKQDKDLDSFNWRSKLEQRRQSLCRDCQKEINKRHYRDNKVAYKERAVIYRDNVKIKFFKWLSEKSCIDCGENDPVVLECDHQYDKKYNISRMINDAMNWELVLKELAKCEIRCANCHKRKTAAQFNWKKLTLQRRG